MKMDPPRNWPPMDAGLRGEREELTKHLAGLAQDLENLQNSLQTARTLREGMASPGHVWPDAPSFDPAEELPPAWVAVEALGDEPGEPAATEQDERLELVLQAYPTFPI